jgi:hypothetical protein
MRSSLARQLSRGPVRDHVPPWGAHRHGDLDVPTDRRGALLRDLKILATAEGENYRLPLVVFIRLEP